MAPLVKVEKMEQDDLEVQLKDIVQDLYELMVQAAAYDNVGPGVRSRDVLVDTIDHLHDHLLTLSQTATSLIPKQQDTTSIDPSQPTQTLPKNRDILIPPELIQYVDAGRNPDIYTREFVELARRGNQLMKGKQDAFASFRDVLAGEMGKALPELREDVGRVVRATGGVWVEEAEKAEGNVDTKMEES